MVGSNEDTCPCGKCKRVFAARLVDAVLLDEDGNDASDEAYCRDCWPSMKRISWDTFTELPKL